MHGVVHRKVYPGADSGDGEKVVTGKISTFLRRLFSRPAAPGSPRVAVELRKKITNSPSESIFFKLTIW